MLLKRLQFSYFGIFKEAKNKKQSKKGENFVLKSIERKIEVFTTSKGKNIQKYLSNKIGLKKEIKSAKRKTKAIE